MSKEFINEMWGTNISELTMMCTTQECFAKLPTFICGFDNYIQSSNFIMFITYLLAFIGLGLAFIGLGFLFIQFWGYVKK